MSLTSKSPRTVILVALAVLTITGPKSDISELDGLLSRLPADVTLHKLVADAGYDSEPNHELLRDHHGIRSVMPATHGRPLKNSLPLLKPAS